MNVKYYIFIQDYNITIKQYYMSQLLTLNCTLCNVNLGYGWRFYYTQATVNSYIMVEVRMMIRSYL